MRWLTTIGFLLLMPARAIAAASPLDAPALDYVKLALEVGVHEDGYIDAYYGPPALKDEAAKHTRSIAALKIEADRIAAAIEKVTAPSLGALEQRRRASLLAYVKSARFRLDMIAGARIPFVDEAERLFGLRPDLKPLESLKPVLAEIETLVPGKGTLADRVEAFRLHYAVPKDRQRAVMDAAIAECRRRTLARLPLPANENFRMEFVTNKSWSAYNWYEGNAQSLIQVNTDLPIFIDRALGLGCHEGYPGHHVQGIYAEKLYEERGWIEFAVAPLFSPQGPLNEGGGNFGIELAFPGDERLAFEQQTLYPLAGLDPKTAPPYDKVRRALERLVAARLTISAMYLDGKIGRGEARDLLQRYLLVSKARAEQLVAFTEHYRSYVINYVTGEDLVRAYATRAGGADAQWRAYERIIGEPTLPEDLR
ncbi:MAG: hypothetical protein U1E87_00905 [Alphaproteobacteria bacterium]